ncbi:MAG: MCE family protein [Puniceicoccaceae bacterium]|nr:MAG: MCE family protein [Puniceicoccaceae bacterium]
MKRAPTIVLGFFVLGALALGVVAVVALGGGGFLRGEHRILISFDESVHGLDIGAPVKLRGVRVGRVTGINVLYHPETSSSEIRVTCRLERSLVWDPEGREVALTDRATLHRLVREGLRARLSLVGITGLLYIEMDFEDPKRHPSPEDILVDRMVVVPSIRSALSEFTGNISEVVAGIGQIDFAGLSDELILLLRNANRAIEDLRFDRLGEDFSVIASSLREMAEDGRLVRTLDAFRETMVEAKGVLERIEGQIEPMGGELAEVLSETKLALQAFTRTGVLLEDMLGPRAALDDELRRSLDSIARAGLAVERLADFLERNPGALLRGK